MIGEVLGIYIVCLWKRERDEPRAASADDDNMGDVLDTLLNEKDSDIRNLHPDRLRHRPDPGPVNARSAKTMTISTISSIISTNTRPRANSTAAPMPSWTKRETRA